MEPIFDVTVWGTVGQWASAVGTGTAVYVAVRKSRMEEKTASEKSRKEAKKIAIALVPAIRSQLEEWERSIGSFGHSEESDYFEVMFAAIEMTTRNNDDTLRAPLTLVERFPEQVIELGSPLAPAIVSAHTHCVALAGLLKRFAERGVDYQTSGDREVLIRRARAAVVAVRVAIGAIDVSH